MAMGELTSHVSDLPALFRLLGPLEVVTPNGAVDLGGLRQSRLLAVLLSSGEGSVPHDQIANALWEHAPQSARQQIYNAVGSLRRTLGSIPGLALSRSDMGYALHVPGLAIDLHQFRQAVAAAERDQADGKLRRARSELRSALDLWRGPALMGILSGSRSLQSYAAQLDEERILAVDRLLAVDLTLNDGQTLAIGDLFALLEQHPQREQIRGSLMIALQQAGRRSDALEVYEAGRRLLADELGLDPSEHLQRIHQQVLRDEAPSRPDGTNLTELHEKAQQRADADRAAYLPRDISEFIGRDVELEHLTDAVGTAAATLVISAIDGMGGVGKTALAVRLSHRLAENFPDGQFFVDLHGFTSDTEALSSAQALERLLIQTGLPIEMVPIDTSDRAGEWRRQVADKRVLVLLDNVVDEAQVRQLLPGTAGSLVLITSRRRLAALEGAVPFSLDVLPREDAVRLFAEVAGVDRVGPEKARLAEVVDLCGRLPLAVRIAAARFRERSSWSVADLLDRLRTHHKRARFLVAGDRDVMAVLRLSYRYLSVTQRRVFRLLSVLPVADFDVAAACAVSGMSRDATEESLESLFECNLLVQLPGDRFEFHDLIRDCSGGLLQEYESEYDKTAAVSRIVDYYLYAASKLCQPDAVGVFQFRPEVEFIPQDFETPGSEDERLRLLKANQPGFIAASRLAIESGLLTHAWMIPCALMPYLSKFNYPSRSEELFEAALAASIESHSANGEMLSLVALAFVARDRSHQPDRALELFSRAIEIAIRLEDEAAQSYLTADLGVAQLNCRQLGLARNTFAEAHDRASARGDAFLAMAMAMNLGVVEIELGHYKEALRRFEAARVAVRSLDAVRNSIIIELNIGLIYNFDGNPRSAQAIFSRAILTAQESGLRVVEAWGYSRRSVAARSLSYLDLAISDGRIALSMARELQQQEIECDALNALGEAFSASGDSARAEKIFMQAERAASEAHLPAQQARSNEGLAHALHSDGRTAAAHRHWEAAQTLHAPETAAISFIQDHLDALRTNTTGTTCPRCWRVDR